MKYLEVDNRAMKFRERPIPNYSSNEVLIKTEAIGVNRADLLQKAGKYPAPAGASDIIGLEVSGEVVNFGTEVKKFQKGDKVMALLSGGGYAEYVNVNEGHIIKIPEKYSITQAAGFMETFLTAYQCLFLIGKWKKDFNTLIHAGASGVGSSAIQLISSQKGRVFATVGSSQKAIFCKSLGAKDVVNYSNEDFGSYYRTKGYKMDLILDCVGGNYTNKNIDILNVDGKVVQIAFMQNRFVQNFDLAKLLSKRALIIGSTLRSRDDDYKTALVNKFQKDFGSYLNAGNICPKIDRAFSWQQVNEAHDYISQNKNLGKVIMQVD